MASPTRSRQAIAAFITRGEASEELRRELKQHVRQEIGALVQPDDIRFTNAAAEDAERQDHAPLAARYRFGEGADRRHFDARRLYGAGKTAGRRGIAAAAAESWQVSHTGPVLAYNAGQELSGSAQTARPGYRVVRAPARVVPILSGMECSVPKCIWLISLLVCLIGQTASADELSQARALSRAFRMAAEKSLPSVVTILSRLQKSDSPNAILDLIGGPDAQVYDSVGSGVIISSDGWILTNHHVIEDAVRIEVRLADGRRFFPDQSLSDPASDVALVKIESPTELQAADIGNSNELAVGDWVLAIGSPFTLESSVSAGIISGTNRRATCREPSSANFCRPTRPSIPATQEARWWIWKVG